MTNSSGYTCSFPFRKGLPKSLSFTSWRMLSWMGTFLAGKPLGAVTAVNN